MFPVLSFYNCPLWLILSSVVYLTGVGSVKYEWRVRQRLQ